MPIGSFAAAQAAKLAGEAAKEEKPEGETTEPVAAAAPKVEKPPENDFDFDF